MYVFEDAPGWARYYAVDEPGNRYWYEHKPGLSTLYNGWDNATGRVQYAGNFGVPISNWTDSLIRRPDVTLAEWIPASKATTKARYIVDEMREVLKGVLRENAELRVEVEELREDIKHLLKERDV